MTKYQRATLQRHLEYCVQDAWLGEVVSCLVILVTIGVILA